MKLVLKISWTRGRPHHPVVPPVTNKHALIAFFEELYVDSIAVSV